MTNNINQRYRLFLKITTIPKFHCQQRNLHSNVVFGCKSDHDSKKDKGLPTMLELRSKFTKMRGIKPRFIGELEDRSYLLKYLPETQEELPPRSIKDSMMKAVIPLSTNPQLEDRYANTGGNLRFGRLMEDMDMFSDFISMNYVQNPKQPKDEILAYMFVTVLVDHMAFTGYVPRAGLDVRITGYVSSVGRTTVETTLLLEQDDNGVFHKITKAIFLMAARNSNNTGGAFVNPLVPADDGEKLIVAEGDARRLQRQTRVEASFMSNPPTPEEQASIHQLFIESIDTTLARRVLPPDSVWMADTRRNNNIFSFTEDRNFQNTVFGGFLMRHALEMAWFTAYFYCQHRPLLRFISDIHFKRPTPIGSVISFHGQVVYTEGKLMQIFVHGDVNNPSEAKQTTSIVFHYTYESPVPIQRVQPLSYYEAMMYIDGRRRFMKLKIEERKHD